MKFLLVIVVVAVMMKSLHAYPASKPDLSFIEAIDRESNILTDQLQVIVRDALPHVPRGQAYDVHRKNFQDFLAATDVYKTKGGVCLEKRFNYTQISTKFMETYKVAGPNATTEHIEMMKLLKEHGWEDLMDEFVKFTERVVRGEFGSPSSIPPNAMQEYLSTHC